MGWMLENAKGDTPLYNDEKEKLSDKSGVNQPRNISELSVHVKRVVVCFGNPDVDTDVTLSNSVIDISTSSKMKTINLLL